MKTKLLLWTVAFLLSQAFYTQTTQQRAVVQPDNPQVELNTILFPFSELDKSKTETGVLLDAVVEFVVLKKVINFIR
ncbi:hypothetical protein [Soonwooa purpurea]